MSRTTLVFTAVLIGALACPRASAAKVIELWRVRKGGPPTQPASPTQPATAEADGGAADRTATSAAGPAEAAATESELASILVRAAKTAGMAPAGAITSLTAEDLAPPAAPDSEAAEVPEEGEAAPPAVPEGGEEGLQPPELPAAIGGEPFDDYRLVQLAAGEFASSADQVVQAALFEFEVAEDAWGLFSRNRGPKVINGIGQAANSENGFRFWKGRYTGVLRTTPPDPRMDEVRLTKFARVIAAMLPGTGRPPEMVAWLPTTNQIPHSVLYFHADGPISSDVLALSEEAEGVAAEYQIGVEVHGVVIVRYADRAAALAGWQAFVTSRTGRNPAEGTPGARKTGILGGRWNATRAQGRVCAFVLGTATRNQAEVALAQALSRATD